MLNRLKFIVYTHPLVVYIVIFILLQICATNIAYTEFTSENENKEGNENPGNTGFTKREVVIAIVIGLLLLGIGVYLILQNDTSDSSTKAVVKAVATTSTEVAKLVPMLPESTEVAKLVPMSPEGIGVTIQSQLNPADVATVAKTHLAKIGNLVWRNLQEYVRIFPSRQLESTSPVEPFIKWFYANPKILETYSTDAWATIFDTISERMTIVQYENFYRFLYTYSVISKPTFVWPTVMDINWYTVMNDVIEPQVQEVLRIHAQNAATTPL